MRNQRSKAYEYAHQQGASSLEANAFETSIELPNGDLNWASAWHVWKDAKAFGFEIGKALHGKATLSDFFQVVQSHPDLTLGVVELMKEGASRIAGEVPFGGGESIGKMWLDGHAEGFRAGKVVGAQVSGATGVWDLVVRGPDDYLDMWTHRMRVSNGWIYRVSNWEEGDDPNNPRSIAVALTFVPDPPETTP